MAARIVDEPSRSTIPCTYHVFLSFRGEDTRNSFTSHLYMGLKQAGFHTFRDVEGIERGEVIESEIQRAIRESKLSIIVFSPNYASSRWCLDELVMILERRRLSGHFILPVFYHVDPSLVSDHSGSYADAFAVHEKEQEMARVIGWKLALREVADLAGKVLDVQNGDEAQFIQGIVQAVKKKMNAKPLHVCSHLVGVDSYIELINLWLEDGSNDARTAIIYGLGGVGKTTIVKTVYNQNFGKFDGACFLANIKDISEQPNGLVRLQRQLLSHILKKKTEKIYNKDEGIVAIKDAVCCRRVLIVLDDVSNPDQLNSIFGMEDMWYLGSKIIVTARRDSLLKIHAGCLKLKVNPLDDHKSFQLFCWHAFGQEHPLEGYMEDSKNLVRHCHGLPLALEVLGSSLACNPDLWKIALQEPEAIDHDGKIQKVLRISYDTLQDDRDKSLFLDIACFLIGQNKEIVDKIAESHSLYRSIGILNLVDRCLLTIDEKNKLTMHQLVRDMGREIVRQESPEDLGRRSRLWQHNDVAIVLQDNIGTNEVRGLACNMSLPKEEKIGVNSTVQSDQINSLLDSAGINFETKALSKMSNLKFLQLDYAKPAKRCSDFPKGIIWLRWHGFPFKSIAKHFCFDKIVVLDMQNSNLINVWNGKKSLPLLKILDLSHSHSLLRAPDVSGVRSLESLILEDCINLIEVHKSIGDLKGLTYLSLKDCRSLKNLPKEIGLTESLKELILSGCSKLVSVPMELVKLKTLVPFSLDKTGIHQSGSTTTTLWSSFWSSLTSPFKSPNSISFSFSVLPCFLVKLNLADCNITDNTMLEDLSCLPHLESLNLSGNPIQNLPKSIQRLTVLEKLVLSNCQMLLSIPELPENLFLFMDSCYSLQTISNLPSTVFFMHCGELLHLQDWIAQELTSELDVEMSRIMDMMVGHMSGYTYAEIHLEDEVFEMRFDGKEIPSWFDHQGELSWLSFDVPSLPFDQKICSLNLCILCSGKLDGYDYRTVHVMISNETQGLSWTYELDEPWFFYSNDRRLWLSQWKLGKQIEGGDVVKVSVLSGENLEVHRCGIHLRYDIGDGGDVLAYKRRYSYLLQNFRCFNRNCYREGDSLVSLSYRGFFLLDKEENRRIKPCIVL